MTSSSYDYDAVVVGAGPNGLAAAITLARAGCSVLLLEANDTIGGGVRSAELTLPGFVHDVCSAIHPLGVASPFFRTLPLAEHGLEWIQPPAALAHPLDDDTAIIIKKSITASGESLGLDANAYRKLISPLVTDWDKIASGILGPLRPPRHPIALARFGLGAIRSARGLAHSRFKGERARAVFAGLAAHSFMPLEQTATAAFGLVMAILAHTVGWPLPRGGAQKLADALASYLCSLGAEIVTGKPVTSMDDLPSARVVLFDVTPKQLLAISGERLSGRYRRQLEGYRYGPGAFKIDYAIDGPLPWKDPACAQAGTVHLGGTFDEIAHAERTVSRGGHPEKPFVLVAQQSLFDSSRAPQGKHTLWAYCHVPNGSTFDMRDRIEAQIERFAPGFRERIMSRHVRSPLEMEQHNANYIGGDINGGVQDLRQLFTRPTMRLVPYSTPDKSIYLCSSSTPPGGGVHGMCGYHAARAALRYTL